VRKLRVIGSSEDFDELILSNKPKGRQGSHVVAIDKRLLDVLQKAVYGRRDQAKADKRMPARIESDSKLPPREIQRFLRAGRSLAQVAREAGMSEEYVEQFLTPVLYERAGVIQEAQGVYQEKQRLGPSSLPLGEAVAANLTSRRVHLDEDALADAWSASRQEGQPWVVSLTFPFRGRARTARWRFDQRTRSLEPVNKLAVDVGWITGGRARAAASSPNGSKPNVRKSTRKGAARKKVARKATKRKAAPKRKAVTRRKPAARRKATGRRKSAARKKAAPRRKPAARRKPARRKAATRKPASRRKAATRKPARRKPARRKATTRKRARRR
jgi:DUF3071 family protein